MGARLRGGTESCTTSPCPRAERARGMVAGRDRPGRAVSARPVTAPSAVSVEVLLAVRRGEAFAKDLLDSARAGLSDPRARGLATEVAYGTLRRRATLDAVLAELSKTPLPRLDPV